MKRTMQYSLAVIVLATLMPVVVSAEMITICVEDVTVPYSDNDQTEWLEVFVESDVLPAPALWEYSIKLALQPTGSGITFAGNFGQTSKRPYVFPGEEPPGGFSFPPHEMIFGGLVLDEGTEELNHDDGILRVEYEVPGGTPLGTMVGVNVVSPDAFTYLRAEDAQGGNYYLAFETRGGSIGVVPEPSTIVLMLGVLLAVPLSIWRRRRAQRKTAGSRQSGPAA